MNKYTGAELEKWAKGQPNSRDWDALAADFNALVDQIEAQKLEVLRANDAATKGDKARAMAAGMEMEINELRDKLAERDAEVGRLRAKLKERTESSAFDVGVLRTESYAGDIIIDVEPKRTKRKVAKKFRVPEQTGGGQNC